MVFRRTIVLVLIAWLPLLALSALDGHLLGKSVAVPSSGEPLLGGSDIQSLADMGSGFDVVRSMRLAPITRNGLTGPAAAVLAPMAPLLLLPMPVEELLNRLLNLIF
jgi:hypothetical protein